MAHWDRRLHPLTHCSLYKPYRSYFKAAEAGAARSRQRVRGSRLYFLPELDSCSKRCLFSLESPPQSHCPTQLPSLLPSPTLCFCFSLGHSAGNSFPLIHTFHPQFFFLNIHIECDHILKPSVPKCHFLGDVPPKHGISHSLLGHPHAADNAVPWQAHSGTSCEGLWTSTCSLQGHISHHPQQCQKPHSSLSFLWICSLSGSEIPPRNQAER